MVLIRIITPSQADDLIDHFHRRHYGVTCLHGEGATGPVEVVFTIVPRREVRAVVELVKGFNPQAFYSVEEVDFVERGVFPLHRQWHQVAVLGLLRPFRKDR